ncbi:MAG: hypothetical protein MK135_17070, partial [Polyangiaceae bacterium]|nr:hypothetical protein [Polyangiaceae bacterium]
MTNQESDDDRISSSGEPEPESALEAPKRAEATRRSRGRQTLAWGTQDFDEAEAEESPRGPAETALFADNAAKPWDGEKVQQSSVENAPASQANEPLEETHGLSPFGGSSSGDVNQPMIDEIEHYVASILRQRGSRGRLGVVHLSLKYTTASRVAYVHLGRALQFWGRLSPAEKAVHAEALARQLGIESVRALPPKLPRHIPWGQLVILGVALSAILAAFFWDGASSPFDFDESAEQVHRVATPTPPETSQERGSRVCLRTRNRVMRGATVGLTDAEGWEVVLLILRESPVPLLNDPVVNNFMQRVPGSSDQWSFSEAMNATIDTSEASLVLKSIDEQLGPLNGVSGLELAFPGVLADAYFRPQERYRFFQAADALLSGFGATAGALFARCEGDPTTHVGSWFRGATADEAVATLLVAMGVPAYPEQIRPELYREQSTGRADVATFFQLARTKASYLSRESLSGIIARAGGMIIGGAGENVTITFPFR